MTIEGGKFIKLLIKNVTSLLLMEDLLIQFVYQKTGCDIIMLVFQ